MDIRSVAALKRATQAGTVVYVEHLRLPDRTGRRTVLKAQTRDWLLSWPENIPNPHGYGGGWLGIPTRDQIAFPGGPTVEFSEDGEPWLRLTVVES